MFCEAKLDFTDALSYPQHPGHRCRPANRGKPDLGDQRGVLVDTDGLTRSRGDIKIRPASDPGAPVILRVHLTGQSRGGDITARPPRRKVSESLRRKPGEYRQLSRGLEAEYLPPRQPRPAPDAMPVRTTVACCRWCQESWPHGADCSGPFNATPCGVPGVGHPPFGTAPTSPRSKAAWPWSNKSRAAATSRARSSSVCADPHVLDAQHLPTLPGYDLDRDRPTLRTDLAHEPRDHHRP